MRYIVVDLEMNPVADMHKNIQDVCKTEIIEIGAVLLDDNYEEISCFKTYVRPQFNTEITNRINGLTGISWEMVYTAPTFTEAMKMFIYWCNKVTEDFQIIQWSENDRKQIEKEALIKDPILWEMNIFHDEKWIDFQQEYGLRIGRNRKTSLPEAVMFAGEDFEGRHHDALFDARNTAELLRIVRKPDQCKKALGTVIEALKEKPVGVIIGELFNLNELCLSA